jgi:hypothetical protein
MIYQTTDPVWTAIAGVFGKEAVQVDTDAYPLCSTPFMVAMLAFYLTVDIVFSPKKGAIPPKLSSVWTMLFFAHNVFMSVFSGVCTYYVVPIAWEVLSRTNEDACTGKWQSMWLANRAQSPKLSLNPSNFTESYLPMFIYLFYLSKYYEFMDSFILLIKGRKPIFLQVYHHVGAVFIMYLSTVTWSCSGMIFVAFNAPTHTIMYTYYAASTLGYRFPFKHLITQTQLLQFIVGICFLTYRGLVNNPYTTWLGKDVEECARYYPWSHTLCDSLSFGYVASLIYLFLGFYKKTYAKKTK